METAYRIRMAQISDAKQAAEVETICFPKEEAADFHSLCLRIQTFPESFLVAEKDEILIGLINGCVTNERTIRDEMFSDSSCHLPDGEYQAVFGLDVLPAFRRQGVAARLMKCFIDNARDKGRKGLILTCKEMLIPYYKKFGYQCMGVSRSTHGGAVWYDMVLDLKKGQSDT